MLLKSQTAPGCSYAKYHPDLISPDHWKVYQLPAHPGVIVILNPFTIEGHRCWIKTCLSKYICKGNKTNLDRECGDALHAGGGLWARVMRERLAENKIVGTTVARVGNPSGIAQFSHEEISAVNGEDCVRVGAEDADKMHGIDTLPRNELENTEYHTASTSVQGLALSPGEKYADATSAPLHQGIVLPTRLPGHTQEKHLLQRLRWVTMGRHYDWDTETYPLEQASFFPSNLAEVCADLASVLRFSFAAETAIVNFYHPVGGKGAG